VKIVEFLLACGSDANATNAFGRTPLFLSQHLAVAPEAASIWLLQRPTMGLGMVPLVGSDVKIRMDEMIPSSQQSTNESVKHAIETLLLRHGAKDADTRLGQGK
jgi:hypothetical protein